MSSYLITGVSRGIGYEYIRQLSKDPKNTVIGIVRNKAATDDRVKTDPMLKSRTNLHILEADLRDYTALKQAADDASVITGGKLDYLILNAGVIKPFDAFNGPTGFANNPKDTAEHIRESFEVHVTATVHLINLFLPQIQAGNAKKIISISSGHAEADLAKAFSVDVHPFYSASKAAQNMIITKFHTELKDQGILCLSMSPGFVNTGQHDNINEEQMAKLGEIAMKFKQYAPDFSGPATPEDAVGHMLNTIYAATVDKNGGDFVSHHGNKKWL